MEAPKHCPLCRGEAVLDGMSESARVRCLRCGCLGPLSFLEGDSAEAIEACEAGAIAAWNRRDGS